MVIAAPGALDALGDHVRAAAPAYRYVIITDETVGGLYAARAVASFAENVDVLMIPPGESMKTRATWGTLTDQMLAARYGRDTTVVALGGGVVGDLAGFVAATYMRGVPIVQVPTTLLAMIDASIGGKTGVDTSAGKNLVGAFHPPAAVVIDQMVLASLPLPVLRSGMAEAIKHGIITDVAYFDRCVAVLPALLEPGGTHSPAMGRLIAGSIGIKEHIVGQDTREGGLRKILNFGHTIGHAVETLSGYALLHGEAVAIGMAAESLLAERVGVAAPGTAARARDALARAGLPVGIPADITPPDIVTLTHGDKKRRGAQIEYALPCAIGAMAGADTGWAVAVDDKMVLATLDGMIRGC
ncbi:MAG TPA: 3-dehydroquinate synthase [Gemmatimonadaceae bacterium]|jgi:3-dehydroquinate synthase|nr:3-dehydroquinate synthase [Gemmatimonadaceae bacterium]